MKIRIALFALVSMFFTSFAFAAATVQSASGDVTMERGGTISTLAVNQNIESGATIRTGKDGHAMLRFDDGQMTALSTNTTFRINSYRYNTAKPAKGNVALSLLKGALRMVTGLIGKFNHSAFRLNTPVATIGIRGTDFMVGLYDLGGVDPGIAETLQGSITMTTSVGTSLVPAGSIAQVAGPTSQVISISASQIPGVVASQFSQLSALNMVGAVGVHGGSGGAATGGANAGGAAAPAGAGAAATGVSGSAVAIGAAVAGAIAAGTGGTTTTTHH